MNIDIAVKAIRIAKIPCSDCQKPITTEPEAEGDTFYFKCANCGHENYLTPILERHFKVLRLLSVALMMEEAMNDG